MPALAGGAAVLHAAARLCCLQRLDALTAEVARFEAAVEERAAGRAAAAAEHPQAHLQVAVHAHSVITGILWAVESVVPQAFADAAAMRDHLLDVCAAAPAAGPRHPDGTPFWVPPPESPAAATEADERRQFGLYVERLAELPPAAAAVRVPRLPYRRVLSPADRRQVLGRLQAAWPAAPAEDPAPAPAGPADPADWHPYDALHGTPWILVLQAWWVGTAALPVNPLRRRLRRLAGPRRLWELHQGNPRWGDVPSLGVPGYELDPALWYLTGGRETVWTAPGAAWLLYADHNGALTVVGRRLVRQVKAAWPAWGRYVWTNPFYAPPPHQGGSHLDWLATSGPRGRRGHRPARR